MPNGRGLRARSRKVSGSWVYVAPAILVSPKRICSILARLWRSIWFALSLGSMAARSLLPAFRLLRGSTRQPEEFASSVQIGARSNLLGRRGRWLLHWGESDRFVDGKRDRPGMGFFAYLVRAQSPCASASNIIHRMSNNASTSAGQGVSDADQAMAVAADLGLSAGTPIFF